MGDWNMRQCRKGQDVLYREGAQSAFEGFALMEQV